MKIIPTMTSLAGRMPAGPVGAGPSAPFTQWLESDGDLPARSQERAFGFSELGVLGSGHPTQTPREQPRAEFHLPAHNHDEEVYIREERAERQPDVNNLVVCGRPANVDKGGVSVPSPLPTHAADHGAGTAEVPFVRPSEVRRDTGPAEPNTGNIVKRHVVVGSANKPFSLIVSEQAGAVQVLAGSPEMSGEARVRLRKAAAELAAEFGVSLAAFTLNGSNLELPPFPRLGVPHGDQRS